MAGQTWWYVKLVMLALHDLTRVLLQDKPQLVLALGWFQLAMGGKIILTPPCIFH